MRFGEVALSGLQGVLANKLRSILTLLGVLIGVGAVILLLAVGNGSAQQVTASIDALGTNTLTVRAVGGTGSSAPITVQTGAALAHAGLGHVSSVVPEATTAQTVSSTTTSESSIDIIGTTPQYFSITTTKVAEGNGFTTADVTADVTAGARVAVIGPTLASELFPTGTALGKQITIAGSPFTVSGILNEQSSVGFNDPNSEIIAPITRVQESYSGYGAVSDLLIAARSAGDVDAAQAEATIELNQLLGATAANEPFAIGSASSLLQTRAASAQSFTVLLGVVAAISLLVGGIGVTNVMLVTVTERTREIGIRKALGATRVAILGQFLIEAAILTLIGGILGVILAVIGAQFTIDGTKPVILGFSIPLALGVSIAIGVFFGVYPAARAAGMRPIQALRSI